MSNNFLLTKKALFKYYKKDLSIVMAPNNHTLEDIESIKIKDIKSNCFNPNVEHKKININYELSVFVSDNTSYLIKIRTSYSEFSNKTTCELCEVIFNRSKNINKKQRSNDNSLTILEFLEKLNKLSEKLDQLNKKAIPYPYYPYYPFTISDTTNNSTTNTSFWTNTNDYRYPGSNS